MDSSFTRDHLSRRSESTVEQPGSSDSGGSATIGRGYGDTSTPLNLKSLSAEGLAVRLREGTWALTPRGVAWLTQDRELSDR